MAAVNSNLPSAVRVANACLVAQGFSGRTDTLSRAYHYWLPLTALLPSDVDVGSVHFSNRVTHSIDSELVTLDALRRFSDVVSSYTGMLNWHNFTLPRVRGAYVRPLNPRFRDVAVVNGRGEAPRPESRAHSSVSDATTDQPATDASDAVEEEGSEPLDAVGSVATSAFDRFYALLRDEKARGDAAGPRPRDRSLLPASDAFAWSYAPQVIRAVYHADVSGPFDLLAGPGEGAAMRLRGPSHPLDHGFEYPSAGAGAGLHAAVWEDDGDPSAPSRRLVRLTLHGSGFMPRQIRCMVGCALAVHRGLLDPAILRAALVLPVCPRLPMAPPGGLVQVRWV